MYHMTQDFEEYVASLTSTPLLEAEEEVALQKKVQNGTEPEAEKLYQHNLKMVTHAVKKFLVYSDMPPMELVEAGNTALKYAISMYTGAAPDVSPSTYYIWWIRKSLAQSVTKYIFVEQYHFALNEQHDGRFEGYFSSFFLLQFVGSLLMFDVDENVRQSLAYALSATFSDPELNLKVSHRNFLFRSPYLRDLLAEQNPGLVHDLEQSAAQ